MDYAPTILTLSMGLDRETPSLRIFVICVEILVIAVQNDVNIKGLK